MSTTLAAAAVAGATGSTTAVIVTRILASRWLKHAMHAARELRRIADLLDPSKPGTVTVELRHHDDLSSK